jgi:HSP20 family molecular chaperone IbpA
MHATTFEMMHDHVRAIHRAITGSDPPERGERPERAPGSESTPSPQLVAHRFAALEALARAIPSVAERVPAFSFAPPLDVIGTDKELIIELSVPGVDHRDVDAELVGDTVVLSGARPRQILDGRIYFHAELPRGPFRRVVRLPQPTSGPPRVEVENGIVRVRLTRTVKSALPQA